MSDWLDRDSLPYSASR